MLSLPLIPPRDFAAHHQPFRPRAESPPPSQPSNTPTAPHQTALQRQNQQRREEERKAHNARAPLTLLTADEAAISSRKAAIRDFGAYWLRPPGISKTLQAMREEDAERIEQEELARQEMNMRDMQAVQEQEDARGRAEEGGEEGEEEEERDLDEDVPEGGVEVSFNEESLVEDTSQLEEEEEEEMGEVEMQMEEAELIGVAQDEEVLGMEHERDLDDSVPEAGSYQHTDTELEDSSSSEESEVDLSFGAGSVQRSSGTRTRNAQQTITPLSAGRARGRGGINLDSPRSAQDISLSSSLVDSSLLSSPVMQRGQRGGARGGVGRRRGRMS